MADRGRPFGLERLRARAHRPSGRGVPRILLPFAIYTAVVVLVVALGAFWLVRRDATVRAERAAADHAVRIAAVLGEELRRPDLAAPMSPERRAQLDQLVRNAAVGPDVLRAKLYGTDGTVLYSSDHELIGTRTDDMEELREVLGGATVRGVEPLDHERAGPGPQGAKAVEVYVPVRLDAAGAPVGVFEVYEDYAPVAAQIRDAITPIAAIFGAALLLLYAALFPIVLRASRRLRRQVAENEHLALHDSLTGLPNRVHFQEALARVLAGPEADAGVAVLVMDLDLFKEINDTLGHDQGDHVLVEVARRLEGGFRLSDTVARLGGDEFAVCLTGVPDPEAVRRIGVEIQQRVGQPIAVGELTVAVEASVGAALVPQHGADPDSLLKRADVAMYAAKAARSGCELYDPQLDEGSPEQLALAGDLGRAIERDELVVHYQPKLDLRTDAVRGVEALVRWQHPRLGTVSPARFVRVAERSGHIRALTRQVLRRAAADCRRWRDEGFEVSVAVNLAGEHLLDPELPGEVSAALADAGLDATLLELEVTEGSLAAGHERAGEVIGRLRALGVAVVLDDFGGSSSLRSLRELPVDGIKIDPSFVSAAGEDARAAQIVRSAIELGHGLGLEVVAEGVESEDVRRELQRLGCDLAQGYHLGEPMTPAALTAWMARRTSSAPIREA